jgi:hypothetical protein
MIDRPGDSVVMLGAVRPTPHGKIAILNPPQDFVLSSEDRLIYLARYFDDFSAVATTARPEAGPDGGNREEKRSRRVLVLGWSAQLAQLIEDLVETGVSALALTLVSRTPLEERRSWFVGRDFPADRVSIEHVEADALASGTLTELDLAGPDTVLIATTPNRESAEESDARALTAYELLRAERDRQCAPGGKRPAIILELAHPGSAEHAVEPGDVLLIRPRLLGFLQSQVTLRPLLNAVFDELFMPTGGASLTLRNGDAATDLKRFGALSERLRQPGDIALGVLLDAGTSGESVVLCPSDDFGWQGNADLVVLSAPPSRGS